MNSNTNTRTSNRINNTRFRSTSFHSLLIHMFTLRMTTYSSSKRTFLLTIKSNQRRTILRIFNRMSTNNAISPYNNTILPLTNLQILNTTNLNSIRHNPCTTILSNIRFSTTNISTSNRHSLISNHRSNIPFLTNCNYSIFKEQPIPSSI